MFKFELATAVTIKVSDEKGHIKGRAEYVDGDPQYYIHYKANDGRAVTSWFAEDDLTLTED